MVKKIAPDLSFTTFSYDSLGNIETSTDAAGKVTTFTRDAAGNVISISNAEGQVVSREYDEFNRLTSVTSNKNEKTSYVYSATGQLLSIVDPNLKVTSFEYDDMDRLVKKVDPVGRVVTLEYDSNGNVTKEIDPAGNVKTFAYNKLDKLIKKVLPDDVYEFDYDIRGNVSMVKNAITQINFEYDHLEGGDVVTVAGTFGVGTRTDLPSMDLEYEYDNHGNRTALIDGDEITSYEYDIGDRLRKIINHKNEVFTFDYDSKNRLKLITRPGSETSYNFFDNDILSQILHKSGSTTISNFEYVVNNIGNITQKRTPAGNFDYGYDGNNQLTNASNPETIIEEIYQYDSLGNRVQDQNGSYTYDQTGQKLQEDYKNFYFYDNNGNLASVTEKGTLKTKNYIYNSENRLVQYKEFDEQANLVREARYAYDALGRRIEKVVTDLQIPANNKTRRYVYDGEDILKVFDESNNVLSKYTHSSLRIDDALAIDDKTNNKSYYFLKDHLGSIIDIVNDDLSFKQHYAYSSFGELQKVTDINGNEITSNPTLEHHFTYTAREYDQESGLYHYRARAYDASVGRFLQQDPNAGDKDHPISVINRYLYVNNSPMNYTDPSGEWWQIALAIVVSAVAMYYDSENKGSHDITIGANATFNENGNYDNSSFYMGDKNTQIGLMINNGAIGNGYRNLDAASRARIDEITGTQGISSDNWLFFGSIGAVRYGAAYYGISTWVRSYPSGGGGVGLNKDNTNIIRLDWHSFKLKSGERGVPGKIVNRPHVDSDIFNIKHWPW